MSLVEIDPERLMQRVRQALGVHALERFDEKSILGTLYNALRGTIPVEMGECSVAGRVATSMELRPYCLSSTLLRQGRLCFAWHGIHSREHLEEDLRQHVEQRYRQARTQSGGVHARWQWGTGFSWTKLPAAAEFLVQRCVQEELSEVGRTELEACTVAAHGGCAIARL